MNAHTDTDLLRGRHDLNKKALQILPQTFFGYVFEPCEHHAKAWNVVSVESARQTSHDIGKKPVAISLGGFIEPYFGTRENLRIMIRFRVLPFEHVHVECGIFFSIEAQCCGAAAKRMTQISPRPVKNRHEIVANSANAAGGQIA